MNTLYVLVGLPGSGKSYIANQLLERLNNLYLVSSDSVRGEHYGDENIQGDNQKLFQAIHQTILNHLNKNQNVIFDATNIAAKHRIALLQKIPSNVEKVCIIVATPIKQCIENNEKRSRVVPNEVIYRMWKSFQVPAYFEGWNKIQIVYNYIYSDYDSQYDIDKIYVEMDLFEQHSKFHDLTVGNHCREVERNLMSQDSLLHLAARLHDYGKLFTQTFTNMRGEPSETAHYYNHEGCGAYEFLFIGKNLPLTIDEILLVASIINYHMRPYGFTSDKAENKFRSMVGESLYADVMALNKADRKGKTHE